MLDAEVRAGWEGDLSVHRLLWPSPRALKTCKNYTGQVHDFSFSARWYCHTPILWTRNDQTGSLLLTKLHLPGHCQRNLSSGGRQGAILFPPGCWSLNFIFMQCRG